MANIDQTTIDGKNQDAEDDSKKQGLESIYEGKVLGTELDIIVVPGLGVDPSKSWDWSHSDGFDQTQKPGFDWIRGIDGLQSQFPKARIMLFKYMSAWRTKFKVRTSLQAIAKDLLLQLNYERKDLSKPRPMIFICHSFGGLVAAKALCMADGQPKLYADIVPSVAGCLFFGTPFQGAELTKLALSWETFRIETGMKDEDYTDLLHFLKRQNTPIMDLRSSMRSLAQRMDPEIPTCSIYETKRNDWGKMIKKIVKVDLPTIVTTAINSGIKKPSYFVDKESASLFEESSIPRHCGHYDLVRFPSKDDRPYISVIEQLRQMVSDAGTIVRSRYKQRKLVSDDDLLALREILETGQDMRRKREILAADTVTESFVVKKPEFDLWCTRAPQSKRYIWVDGPPSTGKTTASLNAINKVENYINNSKDMPSSESILVAWFFCEPQTNCCNAEDLLQSIILQLIEKRARLATHGLAFVKTSKAPPKTSSEESVQATASKQKKPLTVESLWRCLQDILSDSSIKCVYIIINNLHQLPQDSPSTDKLLQSLGSDMTGTTKNNEDFYGGARWFITSSNQYRGDITGYLDNANEVQLFDLSDSLYKDEVEQIRENWADQRSASLARDLGLDVGLGNEIRDTMIAKAPDTAWMDILCMRLNAMTQRTRLPILAYLDHVPAGNTQGMIEDTWQSLFEHMDAKNIGDIKEVLRTLVLVKDPITIRDLSVLTQYKQEDVVKYLEPCVPLIELQGREEYTEVSFSDVQLKDGLRKAWGKLLPISKRSPSQSEVERLIQKQHCQMALNCLSFFKDKTEKLQSAAKQKAQTRTKIETAITTEPDESMPRNGAQSIVLEQEIDREKENSMKFNNSESGGAAANDTDGDNEETSNYGTEEDSDDISNEDSDDDRDDYSEMSYDDWELEEEEEGPPPGLYPWRYLVSLWSYHAAEGGRAAALSLCNGFADFWAPESPARKEWLLTAIYFNEEYDKTTDKNLPALHVAASLGLTDLVDALLSSNQKHEIDEVDSNGLTALYWAAVGNHHKTLRLLLQRHATVDNPKATLSPLYAAAKWGYVDIMETLMSSPNNADPNAVFKKYRSAVHAAIRSSDEGAVNIILAHPNIDFKACNRLPSKGNRKSEYNNKDPENQSEKPKQNGRETANNSNVDAISEENKHKVQDEQTIVDETQKKIKEGDVDEDEGVDDDEGVEDDEDDDDDNDDDALSLAAAMSANCLKKLLEHKKADWSPEDMDNAIWKACIAGRKESLNVLLQSKHVFDNFWLEVCMMTAALQDFWDIVQIILDRRPHGDLQCENIFFLAAAALPDQHRALLSIWDYSKHNISQPVKDAALYQAADYEKLDTVEWLITQCGSDPNADYEKLNSILEYCRAEDVPNYGDSLTAAAYDGNMDMIKLLLDNGAEKDGPKGAALQIAAWRGHLSVVKLLLDRGADKDRILSDEMVKSLDQGESLVTALQAACDIRRQDIVKLLLDAGADPNRGGGTMTYPIISAARLGQEDILNLLLDTSKVNVNVSGGPDGSFPLTNACVLLNLQCVKRLLDYGADINAIDPDGDQAIHIAINRGNTELLKLLLDNGAELVTASKQNSFPLHYAITSEKWGCAAILSEAMIGMLDEIREAQQQKRMATVNQPTDTIRQEATLSDEGNANTLQLNGSSMLSIQGLENQTHGNDPTQHASHVDLQNRFSILEAKYQQIKDNHAVLQKSNDDLVQHLHRADEKYVQLQQDMKIVEEKKNNIQREQEQYRQQEDSRNTLILGQHKDALDTLQYQLDEEKESSKSLSKKLHDLNTKYEHIQAGLDAVYMQQKAKIEHLNQVIEAQKQHNASFRQRGYSEMTPHSLGLLDSREAGHEGERYGGEEIRAQHRNQAADSNSSLGIRKRGLKSLWGIAGDKTRNG